MAFLCCGITASAQFIKKDVYSQNYNNKADSLAMKDSTDKMLDFKEIFGGLAHKRTMRIGTMFGTSVIIPGASQIYNEQYWKLPIVYGGLAAGITCGIVYSNKYNETGEQRYHDASIWSFVGAGVVYYASLMDGVISYKTDRDPHPGRATIYSILCPGLGQAYNGEFWKIPIYVGGIAASAHFYATNSTNYKRYRDIYREASETGYTGPISADQAKYYRDEFRRYRDYSILAMALVYLLQVIDANVFCYMHDFEVTDNLALNVGPSVILPPENAYAMGGPASQSVGAGLSIGLRF